MRKYFKFKKNESKLLKLKRQKDKFEEIIYKLAKNNKELENRKLEH